jgi:hypothetical protein
MPDLERIGQLTPGTLSQQWYEDGAVVDPGTVTVGITRADGTVLVAAGAATTGSGTGARTYNLTTTHTALLDRLTVTWTSTLKGTLLSYVEVVGGFWFSLAELRAIRGLTDTTDYPTSDLAAMRTTVEDAIEEYTGALVPRYAYQTVSGVSGQPIRLSKPYVRTIRSVTVDGTALSVSQIAALRLSGGMLSGNTWTSGFRNVSVGYEHGCDTPPQRVRRAALLLAKVWLINGPVDDRTNTFTSTEGGTYSLVTPGRAGSLFGVPEVDAAVMDHKIPVIA